MGYRIIEYKLPSGYTEAELKRRIEKDLHSPAFSFQIESKSLDARKKNNIFWLVRVGVSSAAIAGDPQPTRESLQIPLVSHGRKAVVTGSGPAGFFASLVLQKAGIATTILERGSDVKERTRGIKTFEQAGQFSATANYAFGEGGAGTFSDGKLTSRSKHISLEREFILRSYVEAGAPEEILYMVHPHVGSDNLKKIVQELRQQFISLGGTIHFETMLEGLKVKENNIDSAITSKGEMEADYFLVAPGHSSYETYRMLMQSGVGFRTKNMALGFRAEHRQEEINLAQWGVKKLPGVKAAEYRLTSDADGNHPVYTFCMCPGGMVVPATAYPGQNIVNGMSYYQRNGSYSNAACVAGVHPDQLTGKVLSPEEALRWLEELEMSFYKYAQGYRAPFCTIRDFLEEKETKGIVPSSYPLGLIPAPLWKMLPSHVTESIKTGLRDFSRKLRHYEDGILLGLESKTSAPIQVIREPDGRCTGFENLWVVGEGSGYAGGIISSAADGVKAALNIVHQNQ